MSRTVFFQDKSLTFSQEAAPEGAFALPADDPGVLQRAKILFFLESHNTLHFRTEDPEAAFAQFAAEFTLVEAAGGVVVDAEGRCLMIHRNERWDLPKGHIEAGETPAEGAVREIEEETGVSGEVVAPLCATWHAYFFPQTNRWELKRTHWFLLRTTADASLAPQTEEGITEVAWCDAAAVEEHLTQTYPTIRCVMAALRAHLAK